MYVCFTNSKLLIISKFLKNLAGRVKYCAGTLG
jgi:hypothetical protein